MKGPGDHVGLFSELPSAQECLAFPAVRASRRVKDKREYES